jgi:hypothetical protein
VMISRIVWFSYTSELASHLGWQAACPFEQAPKNPFPDTPRHRAYWPLLPNPEL